jgi:hypothetical protein
LARLLDARPPLERLLLERVVVERDGVAFDPVERDPDARDDPDAFEADAREPEARELEARDAVERLVLRAEPELARDLLAVEREAEVVACVSAWRSLSKSLSACLFVLAASRRSARSVAVTSL